MLEEPFGTLGAKGHREPGHPRRLGPGHHRLPYGPLTFAEAARYWAGRGIDVYAPDQRGFGANASRKRWPGTDALVADAVAAAAMVRSRHPGLPLVVVGHSMGGGVALAAAAAGMDADALVLAGPAIAGGDAMNPIYRVGGWALGAVAPDKRWTGAGIVKNPTPLTIARHSAVSAAIRGISPTRPAASCSVWSCSWTRPQRPRPPYTCRR